MAGPERIMADAGVPIEGPKLYIPSNRSGVAEGEYRISPETRRQPSLFEVALENKNQQAIDTLMGEAIGSKALDYFYQDIKNLYGEIVTEPTSRYGYEYGDESRRTTADKIELARRALSNYQETFWEYGDPALTGLQSRYKGAASYLASKTAIAIEKNLKKIPLAPSREIGDKIIAQIEQETERENRARYERNPFWDRSWGRVILTGRTPAEVIKGIDNFLEVATREDSNFDAQRNIEDATGLNQEIQRRGQLVGMARKSILEQVARAEGTLLTNVADHFAVRWHVPEWNQVTSLIGKHIDSRLNAVAKAYNAEVIHAADILDTDEEYDKYSRPARYVSDLSSKNDEAAASERARMRKRLEVRIVLSQLKDIDTVVREHLAKVDTQTNFGFSVSASITAAELFNPEKNPQYFAAIDRINKKLIILNQRYANNQPVVLAERLTPAEEQLLAIDRIRPYRKTEDLVVIDQTDEQFRDLYTEWAGFGTEAAYKAKITELSLEISRIKQKIVNNEQLNAEEKNNLRLWERDQSLKKIEKGESLTDDELRAFPEITRALAAADLAIKAREVPFISTQRACASLKTRHNTEEGQGELLSYNDVLRLNKFVRERAIASLPADKANAITAATRDGAGLMYVDIADKLEFRNLAKRVIKEKGADSEYGKNAQEALRLITLTADEVKYADYVQAVEDVQEQVLEKLKEKGSDLTVSDIDAIIKQVFEADKRNGESKIRIDYNAGENARGAQLQRAHKGESQPKAVGQYKYHDIVRREDADPQYNFSMLDDQKYSSLLLSDEIKASAYNSDHPFYHTVPAVTRRVLDPDGTKLTKSGNPDVDRQNAFRVMETQRRFHFAVDSIKVFGAFYKPDLYESEAKKPTMDEIVINIRNSPFIARRMIDQRMWTLWNRGQAYRGRGFLKYLESNFEDLAHGRRGLRGLIASYNGYDPKGFSYTPDFSGALDELRAENWLNMAKRADEIRPVLIGGQVGQDPNFEGLFKKIVKTIGRNNPDYNAYTEIASKKTWARPALARIANRAWKDLTGGDYERAIDEIEDRWKRVTIYGNSLGFVGNTNQAPLAAKFSGDTAVRRLVYWAVTHPEAESAYHMNMDLTRAILEPLPTLLEMGQSYFGSRSTPGSTLLSELMRRAILVK